AGAKLNRALDQLTVSDLDEAADIAARRQVLEQQIATTEARLQALGATELPAALAAAVVERDAAEAEVERRRLAIPEELSVPDSLESARLRQNATRGSLEEFERAESTRRQNADSCRTAHQRAAAAHTAHRETLETARQNLGNLTASANALESNHGDSAARALALEQVLETETRAKATLAATQDALAGLNPQELASSQAAFSRRISIQETNQSDAATRLAIARNTLALDGSQDPVADWANAKARLASLQEEHAREERRAKAIALLQGLFSESQTAISAQVTQPIADRITGYLECVFGPGVRARLAFGDDGGESLELIRPGGATFAFETLSGGAKEQVAAAVRLAMAEILAADHGGCLPLVFDDAFAYADPERVQSLQRMLDLAATRGLQVIVLTCTPRDYLALGAEEFRFALPALK
ncbi:hypothetical protein HQ447_00735, partial [bacterium]|nr:hypothetical protein [bacterium]